MSKDEPKTAGELRRRLAELGDPWTVDPSLGDDDPLPDPPRGGLLDEDVSEEQRLSVTAADVDLDSIIAEHPPTNPLLRARWEEAGLLTPEVDES